MKLDLTNFLLLDGGMGTMLLKAGMPLGTLPELSLIHISRDVRRGGYG